MPFHLLENLADSKIRQEPQVCFARKEIRLLEVSLLQCCKEVARLSGHGSTTGFHFIRNSVTSLLVNSVIAHFTSALQNSSHCFFCMWTTPGRSLKTGEWTCMWKEGSSKCATTHTSYLSQSLQKHGQVSEGQKSYSAKVIYIPDTQIQLNTSGSNFEIQ